MRHSEGNRKQDKDDALSCSELQLRLCQDSSRKLLHALCDALSLPGQTMVQVYAYFTTQSRLLVSQHVVLQWTQIS